MKRFKRNIMTAVVAILCLVSMSMTAFAEGPDKREGECQITFSVTDSTGGLFLDDIAITLLSDDGSLEYTYIMKSANYLSGTTISGTVKPGLYHIALSFASKGDFSVLNADGTKVTSASLMGGEHTFDWVIVYNGGEQAQGGAQGSAEANALWSSFLEAVAPIETDSEYSSVLRIVKNTAKVSARYFAKATGRPEEDYLGMSTFEQFLWYTTYVLPVNGIEGGDYNFYCGSETAWLSNTLGVPRGWLGTHGSDEMLDAYDALMLWDYHYFLETGKAYNFIDGQPSEGGNPTEEPTPTDGPAVTDPPVEPTPPASGNDAGEEDETDIWGGTKALIKKKSLAIVVLLALAGALGGIIIYRKKKNIDD